MDLVKFLRDLFVGGAQDARDTLNRVPSFGLGQRQQQAANPYGDRTAPVSSLERQAQTQQMLQQASPQQLMSDPRLQPTGSNNPAGSMQNPLLRALGGRGY